MTRDIAYTRSNVKRLVAFYAYGASRPEKFDFREILSDFAPALARMPARFYDALTLHGLKGYTAAEAAQVLNVSENTVRNRYGGAIDWLLSALNGPPTSAPIRPGTEWRDWALRETADESAEPGLKTRRGRPSEVAPDAEAKIVTMYCRGCSQRQIVDALNEQGIPTARGGKWGRSSLRRVLDRYSVPLRPRGRPAASKAREPLCDADEIIDRERRPKNR